MSVQCICFALMLTCYESYVLFFALMFIKDMFGALSIIYLPAMKADMMDYQQYKTGDRLEGFIDQCGVLLGSVITLATGYAIPMILRNYGLTNNYTDLYNADFRNPLIRVILICSLTGTILSLVPFLFYDLTEEKRSNMVRAFRIRALFSDFDEKEIEEKSFVKTVEEIYFVIESYETEKDAKMKAAYNISFDEFEKYRNENPQLWQRIEEKYRLLSKAE